MPSSRQPEAQGKRKREDAPTSRNTSIPAALRHFSHGVPPTITTSVRRRCTNAGAGRGGLRFWLPSPPPHPHTRREAALAHHRHVPHRCVSRDRRPPSRVYSQWRSVSTGPPRRGGALQRGVAQSLMSHGCSDRRILTSLSTAPRTNCRHSSASAKGPSIRALRSPNGGGRAGAQARRERV
jgi:hypothetical protein